MRSVSQVTVIGRPQPRTWDDYEQGCLDNYGGGHHTDGHLEAFRHGMSTVFNLLRAEFPPAELCQQAAKFRDALVEISKLECNDYEHRLTKSCCLYYAQDIADNAVQEKPPGC